MARIIVLTLVLTACAGLAAAQQPRLAGGQIQPAPLAGSLDRTIREIGSRASEPVWLGYAVPIIDGDHDMCCWSDGGTTACHLEPGASNAVNFSSRRDIVRLASGDQFFVLFRLERGQVSRIRSFTEECLLDADGRTLHWLTSVAPSESVSVLTSYASAGDRKLANSAVSAIAMHADPTALDTLVKLARSADNTHARGQALFWLAQRAGEKAIGTITEAIEKDPETDVKRRAVFALSQLPKDQGVPLLIDTARNNRNPAVRKQAIFWLGQSKDPRALRFFEEILFK